MKYALVPSLLVLCLLSCTKDKNTSEPTSDLDQVPQFAMSAAKIKGTAKFLEREVSYSKTSPQVKNVKLFAYDDSNRCTEIKLGVIDSSISNPVFTLKQTLTFSYDGSSLMPASVSSVRTVFPNLVTTYYYTYNSLGRKTRDSVRVKNQAGNPADKIIRYVYDGDQVYATPEFNGFPLENNSFDTLSLLGGGNIEKLVSKHIRSTGDQITTYTFTYDKAVSPFNQLNISNSLYFESPSIGLGYNVPMETHYMGVTTNNMTSWTSGNYTVHFKYVYDQEKYPVRKEMFLPGETEPSMVTLFEY